MCKQYPYFSQCANPHYETLIGRKNRNRYCPDALRARRLGKCAAGVEVKEALTSRGRAKCAQCKVLARREARADEAGDSNDNSFNTASNASEPRNAKRKADSVLSHASSKRARLEGEETWDDGQGMCPEPGSPVVKTEDEDEDKEIFVVQSPVGVKASPSDDDDDDDDDTPCDDENDAPRPYGLCFGPKGMTMYYL
ncbi:hypothetical protein F5X99DRAFT_404409 [Biscogniauxia marginata]|nr:hypothetical protein F5X99DRAFT_404409 [Biscogniauxia marginata]